MMYQVDFLLPLKVQKILYYFGLCWKILLVNQFAGFFTLDLLFNKRISSVKKTFFNYKIKIEKKNNCNNSIKE